MTIGPRTLDLDARELRRSGNHFDPGTNIVDVVINHLRKKIEANAERK